MSLTRIIPQCGLRTLLAAHLLTGLALAGCSGDDNRGGLPPPPCNGNGELHDDHCHCDPGFVTSADELSCLPAPDAGTSDNDAGVNPDAGSSDAGSSDAGVGGFSFEPSQTRGATGAGASGKLMWLLEASDGDTLLALEIYEEFGGPISPGLVDLTAPETNYATCGTCLLLRTGCTAHGDHFDCERTFMPRAEGQVRFDALGTNSGERLTGEFLSVVFQQVTIGSNFETQPVADGDILYLDPWTFDVQLEALGGAEPECGGHGHLHGGECHCDSGYRLDPSDPTNCVPE